MAQPAVAQVVVYTSTDQEYAEVILKEAQAAIGQRVTAVYDAEASKTVGLERRLVAEKTELWRDSLADPPERKVRLDVIANSRTKGNGCRRGEVRCLFLT